MTKKTISIIIIVVLILVFLIYQVFIKEKKPEYSLVEVIIGNVVQEISETGTVKRGEKINLSFKTSGRIEKIYVKVGDTVMAGAFLAKLDTNQLAIQLTEANASLDLAQAKLNQLLAGSSQEEIEIAETTVANAQITLEDVKTTAEENLNQDYEDALNTLDSSYLKIYNAYNTADSIQETYFSGGDQESCLVKENKNIIANARNQTESYLNTAKNNPVQENIDIALEQTKTALNQTYNALTIIRNTIEAPAYENSVSSTDKDSIDTQKSYINTALTNTINAQQTISSTKLTNELDINTAEGLLKKAQDELALKKAGPRPADIDLCQAQVKQAQANVSLLENQIQDCVLKSPVQGQITEISQKPGEMAKNTVISLIPKEPFQIEVDIYEEDIVKMSIGNPVDISFVAFPDKIFNGKVASIDPAEKLIEEVVYYRVIIDFEEMPEKIHPVKSSEAGIPLLAELFNRVKPGMTTDLVIKTASKENVLIIPEEAVQKKDDKIIVQVFEKGSIKEREIETGLLGSDDMLEIISGLKAGEKVILPD